MSWWETDPRYGGAGWTLIWPANGGSPYFVKQVQRKRRKPGRAIRFEGLQVGEVLIHRAKWKHTVGVVPVVPGTANNNAREEEGVAIGFARVEHRWFDPVKGEDDPVSGEMAAIRAITPSGFGRHLAPHTLRGLASNGYFRASPEQSRLVMSAVEQRCLLIAEFEGGSITQGEARMAVKPWRTLLRELGLEEPEPRAASLQAAYARA